MKEAERKKLGEIADDLMGSIQVFSRRIARDAHQAHGGKFDPSMFVLKHVEDRGPIRMSEIGRHMEVSKPYMTNLVDKLISEGLVERVTDPDDRRVVEIRITSSGRQVLKEFTKTVRDTVIKRLSSLESEDISSLHDSMRNIRMIISRLDKDR